MRTFSPNLQKSSAAASRCSTSSARPFYYSTANRLRTNRNGQRALVNWTRVIDESTDCDRLRPIATDVVRLDSTCHLGAALAVEQPYGFSWNVRRKVRIAHHREMRGERVAENVPPSSDRCAPSSTSAGWPPSSTTAGIRFRWPTAHLIDTEQSEQERPAADYFGWSSCW